MPPIADRDLLALEPSLFRDVSFLAQQLFRGQVSITSGVMSVASGTLDAPPIAPGHIVVVDDRPLEVIARPTSTSATLSLLRADREAALLLPPDVATKPAIVTTFAPQIALIHAQLLRLLGLHIPATSEPIPDLPTESDLTNPEELRLCEALGTLHLIHAAASALTGPDALSGRRAEMYRLRFNAERRRVRALIDTNHDGHPDATRTLSILHLVR